MAKQSTSVAAIRSKMSDRTVFERKAALDASTDIFVKSWWLFAVSFALLIKSYVHNVVGECIHLVRFTSSKSVCYYLVEKRETILQKIRLVKMVVCAFQLNGWQKVMTIFYPRN